jgi:hypothetical protein
MTLSSLSQPPFNTSLLGVIWGASRYYGFDYSRGLLFGATGHAFLINVHKELCPSSPYVWNHEPLYELVQNLGIDMALLGHVDDATDTSERTQLEDIVKERMERGVVCGILNLDHQLIVGHDDAGFDLALPWGEDCATTPPRLSYATWSEFGDELHAEVYELARSEPRDLQETVRASIEFAVGLWEHPAHYAFEDYGIGPRAYANWISAVENGHGNEHGAWWNASVWSECRDAAKEYLREIARHIPQVKERAHELSGRYGSIAEKLHAAGERSLPIEQKIRLISEARELEAGAVDELAGIRDALARMKE